MTTKILYVLVSTPNDYYLEQNLISAYSLRYYNPDANITIVVDRDSYNGLVGKRAEIKKYVTEFVVVDCPKGFNGLKKSRYIKTNLRFFVSGDFLYIDSDTVIADSLDEIDTFDGDLGAVYDSNRSLLISDSNSAADWYIISLSKQLEWPSVVGWPNYNGGVMFARDSELSYKYYKRWYELWQESSKKGVNLDMPALCRANVEMGGCIKELSGIWNCQIQRQGLPLLPQAKIIHCFTGGNVSMYSLCTERILNKVKSQGYLDDEVVGLIKNARTAFEVLTSIVTNEEAQLVKYPIVQLYFENYSLFRILNKFAEVWFKLFKGRAFRYE